MRNFIALVTMLGVVLASGVSTAAPRLVIGELFTNTG